MKKITFYVCQTVKQGDEEKQVLTKQVCVCSDSVLESNLVIVKRIAYNGVYTVEDEEREAPEPTADDVLNALLGVT